MNNFPPFTAKPVFQSGQIICLEHQDTRLYGEVIQIISQREQCWFRPLFLAINSSESEDNDSTTQIIQLNNSYDLLWPICLFRFSLDTEVIPLLSIFSAQNKSPSDELLSRKYLHQFIQQVWQANQDKF